MDGPSQGNSTRPPSMVAWERLRLGNARFVAGQPEHPGQDAARRATLSSGQRPYAMIFGCCDSRVAAEIIFDQGLGDLFVVRTAGHVLDTSVLGSIEFGVAVLGIPLVVILGHDQCGAVQATLDALADSAMPAGFVRDIVERVTPSVLAVRRRQCTDTVTPEQVEAEHVRQTAALLTERSTVLRTAVGVSRAAIIGATYRLREGQVRAVTPLGAEPGTPTT